MPSGIPVGALAIGKAGAAYLNMQRMRVSARSKLKECMIVTGGPKNQAEDKELSLIEYKKFSSKVHTAYRKYSKKYISNEINAKNEKLGVWQGKFEMPWDYRRKK